MFLFVGKGAVVKQCWGRGSGTGAAGLELKRCHAEHAVQELRVVAGVGDVSREQGKPARGKKQSGRRKAPETQHIVVRDLLVLAALGFPVSAATHQHTKAPSKVGVKESDVGGCTGFGFVGREKGGVNQ